MHDFVIHDDEEVKEEVDPKVLTLRISSDLFIMCSFILAIFGAKSLDDED